jgi:hypothetical protein
MNDRAPVAAAPVDMAPIMHWTHMLGRSYRGEVGQRCG